MNDQFFKEEKCNDVEEGLIIDGHLKGRSSEVDVPTEKCE